MSSNTTIAELNFRPINILLLLQTCDSGYCTWSRQPIIILLCYSNSCFERCERQRTTIWVLSLWSVDSWEFTDWNCCRYNCCAWSRCWPQCAHTFQNIWRSRCKVIRYWSGIEDLRSPKFYSLLSVPLCYDHVIHVGTESQLTRNLNYPSAVFFANDHIQSFCWCVLAFEAS